MIASEAQEYNVFIMSEGSAASPENRRNESSEVLFNPKSIAIVTGTLYSTWYEGETRHPLSADKVRGDLAFSTFTLAKNKGYNLVVIDGGSSDAFKKALEKKDIPFTMQIQAGGIGSSRRQGIEQSENTEGVKIICPTEPEKVSIVSDCIQIASLPILKNEADIVVLSRNNQSFSTYPQYQARQEQKANVLYNKILRSRGLLREEDPDLDFWFGARFFANRPDVTELFKEVFQFNKGNTTIDKLINLEMYSNVQFFPIVTALHKGLRVKSVEVPYKHPRAQTAFEEGNPSFDRKRDIQRRTITTELIHFIRMLENSPKSRLSKS